MTMEIEIDFTKSAQQNASDYYERSKKLLVKKAGAERAVKDLEKKLKEERLREKPKPELKTVKLSKGEWYEKFHWFYASNGMLAIGGRDAHQNELINSRHFNDNDLFFHANIFGASAVVLIGVAQADRDIRQEAAEFAACYSSAWKEGLRTVDVYAMKRDQVSKSTGKGSLGTGSFLLSGERDWYRGVQLSLIMYAKDGKLSTVSRTTFEKTKEGIQKYAKVSQGSMKKSDAAKKISAKLGYEDLDTVMRQLPVGEFRIE